MKIHWPLRPLLCLAGCCKSDCNCNLGRSSPCDDCNASCSTCKQSLIYLTTLSIIQIIQRAMIVWFVIFKLSRTRKEVVIFYFERIDCSITWLENWTKIFKDLTVVFVCLLIEIWTSETSNESHNSYPLNRGVPCYTCLLHKNSNSDSSLRYWRSLLGG